MVMEAYRLLWNIQNVLWLESSSQVFVHLPLTEQKVYCGSNGNFPTASRLSLWRDNIILFEFNTKRDKKKVIKGGPWYVDCIILVLKECPQDISAADIDFSVACF